MNVAIVGTSINLTENEERDVRQYIAMMLKSNYLTDDIQVLSGGAKGVDSIAVEVARGLFMKTKVFPPKKNEKFYYFQRNEKIAKECDELYCITIPTRRVKCYHHDPPQDHEKTAGCWTMNKALKLKKQCKLIVIEPR